MKVSYLTDLGMICALGTSLYEIKRNLLDQPCSGVRPSELFSPGKSLPVGCVQGSLPAIGELPVQQRSRNNQLALAALAQIRPAVDDAIERYGAARCGVVIGTSTSGIAQGEAALRHHALSGTLPDEFHYGQQELNSSAATIASVLSLGGPAYANSSACASSAKALASAARLLNLGVCDAVIAGGVDSLCRFTVAGFDALDSVSATRCNPLSRNRNGINIGEGAALFLMTRKPATVALRGWGESSDAHHISAPDPHGQGAVLAIESALARAEIRAQSIDYVNLHGTGTIQNDAMEARVVGNLLGEEIPVSSTKPMTGHALGAAGAIEAGFCWLTMQDDNASGVLPGHLWDGVHDPELVRLNIAVPGSRIGRPVRWALSNSFAFGGANAALVFGRE